MLYIGHISIHDNIQITTAITVYGTFKGEVEIVAGGRLELYGKAEQSITVHDGGYLTLYGNVEGDVTLWGGKVTLAGYVKGSIYHHDGTLSILPSPDDKAPNQRVVTDHNQESEGSL